MTHFSPTESQSLLLLSMTSFTVVVYISSILFVFHSRIGAGLLWRNWHDRKKSPPSCQNAPFALLYILLVTLLTMIFQPKSCYHIQLLKCCNFGQLLFSIPYLMLHIGPIFPITTYAPYNKSSSPLILQILVLDPWMAEVSTFSTISISNRTLFIKSK